MKARKGDNVVLYFAAILFLFVMAVHAARADDLNATGNTQERTAADSPALSAPSEAVAPGQSVRDDALNAPQESPAPATPSSAPKWYDSVRIGGFVDTYYAGNTNRPQSHDNFIPETGTTAKRANEFGLNLAALELVSDPKPVGFHLVLVAGNGAEIVHASEPGSSSTGPSVFRNIYQASVSYTVAVGHGLLLEAGIFPSHIGFEGFYSKDNWNYTRSWLGELSPYYQTGVHAGYHFNEHWSGELHLLNGWQIIGDNNDAKAIGGKIAYSDDRLSTSFNTFDGPELPNDNAHWRHFGDLIVLYKTTPSLTIGGSLDRGHQELPGQAAANWLGIAGYGRYTLGQRRALAVRVERFSDPDNGISGTSQKLTEATLTYEYRPVENLILKVEGRRDHSTALVFDRGVSGESKNQTIVVIGAVVTFGG